jgi:adenylate kinase family enzyme
MKRVMVIGSPGAGEATLARELAEKSGLPLVNLDQHYWSRGWIAPPRPVWIE